MVEHRFNAFMNDPDVANTARRAHDQRHPLVRRFRAEFQNAQRIFRRYRDALGMLHMIDVRKAAIWALGQIEATLGHPIHHTFPSDYKTVSAALNSGVPLALTGNSDIAMQFDQFTRRLLDPTSDSIAPPPPKTVKRGLLGLEKIASIW